MTPNDLKMGYVLSKLGRIINGPLVEHPQPVKNNNDDGALILSWKYVLSKENGNMV